MQQEKVDVYVHTFLYSDVCLVDNPWAIDYNTYLRVCQSGLNVFITAIHYSHPSHKNIISLCPRIPQASHAPLVAGKAHPSSPVS